MSELLRVLPEYLTGHLQLTLVALVLGTAASLPLGVVATRVAWLGRPVLGVASVVQTIPSLALLALMVPLLAALGVDSIGYLPAIIALTLYSVLPILRNTVTGIQGVDPALVEAARGVGMTPRQVLWRVELPLALPVIVAGLRTATVWVVGVATLSTPVGATSLGNYIFSGLQTRNFSAVLLGCVLAAALALLLDGLVYALQQGAARHSRALTWVASGALLGLCVATAAVTVQARLSRETAPVRFGAKTFTEQYVLSEVLAGQVTRVTGLPTETLHSLGSTVAFDALINGEIDAYVDYSGTVWATLMHRESIPSRERVLDGATRWLREEHGVEVAAALGFENTYAMAVRRSMAEELDLRTVTDLLPHARGLVIGGDFEFFGRPEWPAVRDMYGLAFAERRSMDSSLMYQAVAAGQVDVIAAYSTDGRIEGMDLALLEDGRGAIPPYDAFVLVGPHTVRQRPQVLEALRCLEQAVDAATMRQMNHQVDDGQASPREVARAFLEDAWSDRLAACPGR